MSAGGHGCSSASVTRSCSPRRRPAAGRCTSTPVTRRGACRWSTLDGVRRVRRRGRTVGIVRRLGPPPARDGRPSAPGDAALRPGGSPSSAPRIYELSELLVDVLGVTDVGAYFPHRVTYHPTCHSLRMLRVGDEPLRLLRRGARASTSSSCRAPTSAAASAARSRSRTPTPRWRCAPTRSATSLATGAEVLTAGDTSCLMHIGGAAVAAASRHPRHAPGRDPGRAPEDDRR